MRSRFFARVHPFRFLVLLLAGGAIGAPPQPAPALRTATYDVRDLIWNGSTIEEITRPIVCYFGPDIWRQGGQGGPTVREIDGSKLEIRATDKQHQEIAEILAALRALADFAVIWEAQLLDIDADRYQKEVLPALKKDGGADAILKKCSVVVHSSKRTALNGKQIQLLSLRRPVAYRAGPRDHCELAYNGLSFQIKGTVSRDRRYVHTTVVQHSSEVVGLEKKSVYDPVTDKEVEIESPNLREARLSSSNRLDDGSRWLVPVVHPTPEFRKKGRILVLAVRPTIYIDAEQKFLFGR